MTSPTLTSNCVKIYQVLYFFKVPSSAETSCESCVTQNVKKLCFDVSFNYILSKVWLWHHRSPHLLRSFTAISDHPRWRSPDRLCSAVQHGASQDSSQFLVPGHAERGGGSFSVGFALSLFLSELMAPHHSGKLQKL